MLNHFTTPEKLLDRAWRPGHPFRPRLSTLRKWSVLVMLLVLVSLIVGYWYITDANRVRAMAQRYLSELIGGRVEIGAAHLSIFEGLRLENVAIYIDESNAEESQLFSASTFVLQYDPLALLTGRVDAQRIIAIDPRVRLIENVDTRQWNYQRRRKSDRPVSNNIDTGRRLKLPEFLLRNAQVQYSKVRDGRIVPSGQLTVEGQLSPGAAVDQYLFKMQSRGTIHRGPSMRGQLKLDSGEVNATLSDFEFDRDIKALLPEQVRTWWEYHGLAGRIDQLDVNANLSSPNQPFEVRVELGGVNLTVQPEELMSRDEIIRRSWLSQSFDVMRLTGLNQRGFVDALGGLIQPAPIKLENAGGTFVFTEKGIDLQNVSARIEGNTIEIAGRIDGYRNDVPFHLKINSPKEQNVYLSPALKYINSMPPVVREVYNRFRPVGTAALSFNIDRDVPGGKPNVAGEINIIDGQFAFEKFAYPVRKATGQIRIDRDPDNGQEYLKIIALRGRGVEGEPNENSFFEINGQMGPFTPDMAVLVTVKGANISSEPALIAAFPPLTQEAIRFFDAERKGNYPKFRGSFTCEIERYRAVKSNWRIQTDITLDDAEGAIAAFPYPMKGVTAVFTVYDDYVQVKNAHFRKGDAVLDVWGRVDWGRSDPSAPLKITPDLQLHASAVPFDADLLNALPPLQKVWLEKLGVTGRFDLDGRIKGLRNNDKDVDFEFNVALKDASLWPFGGTAVVTGMTGALRLTPDRLTLTDIRGKREDCDVTTRGSIAWVTQPPQIAIVTEARNLKLDASLYQLLPQAAQVGWDQVRPEGTVDAQITFSGSPHTEGPTTRPMGFEIVLTPKSLAATPLAVPYRLEQIAGQVVINPTQVKLDSMTARHKDAAIKLSAIGSLSQDASWDFHLTGENVLVDEDFRKALPEALADLLKASEFSGAIGFEFDKLHVTPISEKTATTNTTQPAAPPVNVDFVAKIKAADASLNIGVPLNKVNGFIQLSGSSGDGRLTDLSGFLDISTMLLGDRPVKEFSAKLKKYPQRDAMQLYDARAAFAGGEVAGQVDWTYPEQGPSRYASNIVLRSADVAQITGEVAPDFRGQVSASMSLEGEFNNTSSRIGRGDVVASGEEMYRIPVLLGLLQVTNLALPITSPFSEATCRYSIDGSKLTFESIELRAKEMMMQGNGYLDFDKMQVRLSFVTESTSWLKVPVVGDLIQGARNELLQIQVKGSIEQPKVSASSMNTLTTTVDEVMKGPPQAEKKK